MAEPQTPQGSSGPSLVAIIFFTSYLAILDGIELLLPLVGLDDFLITDMLAFPVTQLYIRWKGMRGAYNLAGNVIEFIPYVGALPLKTFSFLLTVWLHRRQERKAALEQAQSAVQQRRGSGTSAPAPRPRAPVLAKARAGMDVRVAR